MTRKLTVLFFSSTLLSSGQETKKYASLRHDWSGKLALLGERNRICVLLIWNSIFRSLFSTQLTHNILRNFSKKFSPTWRSFNKFTLLVTSSKTQLTGSIIIPRWRTAYCFWSKYFENQPRYEKVVKGLHIKL